MLCEAARGGTAHLSSIGNVELSEVRYGMASSGNRTYRSPLATRRLVRDVEIMNGISATAIFRPRSDLGRFVETHVTPAVKMAVEESCEMIETRAKELCPVDTGALQASITTEIEELPSTIRGTVSPHMHYAAYVEYGTGQRGAASAGAGAGPYSESWPGMAASPYMRPAMDSSREKIVNIFAHDLSLAIK